jgi:hypothetical protein
MAGGRGIDTIRMDSVADGWTLRLCQGKVLSDEAGELRLSSGASGVIRLVDGSQLRFCGIERIEAASQNQAPGIVEFSAGPVLDTAAEGTAVGSVIATDPDAGGGLTYALLDDAGGRFAIDPATGMIRVADPSLLDYWTADQHGIVVQVTDAGGLSSSAAFSIAVAWDNSGDDTVNVGDADDVIDGGPGKDQVFGEGGDDHLIGGSGDDELDGGDGHDVLEGADGEDMLAGGDGEDRLDGSDGKDFLFGNNGDDQLSGGHGDDQLFGGLGDDRLDGGVGDDQLFGSSGNDLMDSGEGEDVLFGSLGEDVLRAGADADRLNGETGNDVLIGGSGDDVLSGGAGADRFVFDGADVGLDLIADFGNGDVLAIGGMLTGFAAGRETEFVNLLDDGAAMTVQVDADGALNGSAFESIAVLSGVTGTSLSSLASAGKVDFWLS